MHYGLHELLAPRPNLYVLLRDSSANVQYELRIEQMHVPGRNQRFLYTISLKLGTRSVEFRYPATQINLVLSLVLSFFFINSTLFSKLD